MEITYQAETQWLGCHNVAQRGSHNSELTQFPYLVSVLDSDDVQKSIAHTDLRTRTDFARFELKHHLLNVQLDVVWNSVSSQVSSY